MVLVGNGYGSSTDRILVGIGEIWVGYRRV